MAFTCSDIFKIILGEWCQSLNPFDILMMLSCFFTTFRCVLRSWYLLLLLFKYSFNYFGLHSRNHSRFVYYIKILSANYTFVRLIILFFDFIFRFRNKSLSCLNYFFDPIIRSDWTIFSKVFNILINIC